MKLPNHYSEPCASLQTIQVDTSPKPYPIYIAAELLSHRELLRQHIVGDQVMIVSNSIVAKLYLDQLKSHLTGYQCHCVILEDGEAHKTIASWQQILDALLAKQHRRNTTLIALGGGVVGDLTGFAAACYHRGVAYIQIPTTLLAQIDASIGGKTAVDVPQGKNLIGAYHQPRCVLIDPFLLSSLPRREFIAGIAEMIKYGLILDPDFFSWLEDHSAELLAKQAPFLQQAIAQCCELKAQVVAADCHESDYRAILNFGHSFAHAIEAATQYKLLLHGEAVAIGMTLAARYSQHLDLLDEQSVDRIIACLQQFGLPTELPKECDPAQLAAFMLQDKKNQHAEKLRLILLHAIGKTQIVSTVAVSAATEWLSTQIGLKEKEIINASN